MSKLTDSAKELMYAARVYMEAAEFPNHATILPAFWPWDRSAYVPLPPAESLLKAASLLAMAADISVNGQTEGRPPVTPWASSGGEDA